MAVAKSITAVAAQALILALLAAIPPVEAAPSLLPDGSSGETIQVRYDPVSHKTQVAGRLAHNLCFSFSLPQEWHLKRENGKAGLASAAAGIDAAIEVGLRSAHEIGHIQQPDLARRDAAFLQQGYEELLGRPAQSVSLSASDAGAMRWSATWIDANLPSASHALTVETFIVPLSGEWLLELSLDHVEMKEVHDAVIRRILADLRIERGVTCGAVTPLAGRHLSSR